MVANAKPILLWENQLEIKGISSISQEAAGFPKENLFDWRDWSKWRSTSGSDQNIIIDTGAPGAVDIDSFAIIGHNLGSETATISVLHDDDAGFPSPTTVLTKDFTDDAPFFGDFTSSNERYWSIRITSIDGLFIEAGLIFLGEKYTFSKHPQDGFDITGGRKRGRVNRAVGGNILGASTQIKENVISASFFDLPEADRTEIVRFFDEHAGNLKPWILIPDKTNNSSKIYLLTLNNNPNLSTPGFAVNFNYTLAGIGPDISV